MLNWMEKMAFNAIHRPDTNLSKQKMLELGIQL